MNINAFPEQCGAAAPATPRCSILLAEDEETTREALCEYLRFKGYRVITAENGEAALALAQEEDFDLLLTDVMMPRMNGCDLSQEVLKLKPRTRVLFISGRHGELVVEKGLLRQEMAFLQKPFRLTALANAIESLLRSAS
jgi:two-component system cell cycle response regulator CpdR